jgi:hypothetical protein
MHPHFTEDDKKACEPVIHRLIALACIARKEGVLALDEAVESEPDVFLKQAVTFVVDAVSPKNLRKILKYIILASNHTGAELLRMFIIAEGALLIQKGENPSLIHRVLGSILGMEYVERVLADEKAEASYIPSLEEFLGKFNNAGGDGYLKWQSVNNELLKAAFNEFDARDIAFALKGSPSFAVHKVMGLLDAEKQGEVIAAFEHIGPVRRSDASDAAEKIFAELERLDAEKYDILNKIYTSVDGKKVKLRIYKTPKGENTFEIKDDSGKIYKVCASYRQLSAHVLLELTDRNVNTDEIVTELWALRSMLKAESEDII